MKRKSKNHYLSLYLSFLRLEIPNIVQILGIPTLFGIFLNQQILSFYVIPIGINLIIWQYLSEKMAIFLTDQIINPHSYQNRHKLDDEQIRERWIWYVGITAILSTLVAHIITRSVTSFTLNY